MKRARDIRDQLLGLMERCEIELLSNPGDIDAIRKARGRGGGGLGSGPKAGWSGMIQKGSRACPGSAGAGRAAGAVTQLPPSCSPTPQAITSGFFYHTANLQKNGSYRTVKNPQVGGHKVAALAPFVWW